MTIRTGIDLVSVEAVRESLQAYGDRYLGRTYTEREVADCQGDSGPAPERLAARFAAKEATMKALRLPPDEGLDWRSIELVREHEGWTSIRLSGRARELAARAGIVHMAVSVTHEGPFAAAVVIASCTEGSRETA